MWTGTNLLAWLLVGGVAGWLASLVVRGTGLGQLGDILVGILGAFLGDLVLSLLLGAVGFSGFALGRLFVSFVGAMILLMVARHFSGRRTGVPHSFGDSVWLARRARVSAGNHRTRAGVAPVAVSHGHSMTSARYTYDS
jgi:uncharacterized membrane protein YeaQ/YmgE (transglycosylase-associated protein family)